MMDSQQGRFLPGAMVAGRYRIVALLGRGGMGEVYRADDTQLGVAVALKFLPERLERDLALRERMLQEVRVARQVAHPHVCRVYDVGQVDGRAFVSMEYVDGEDLARLLERVGRLTGARAVQIAQQIAAGLAAAHDQGILHRDLKPANIMIDGRGRARLMDFGLAGLASTISEDEVRAGTPAYMAPEQLMGREVTAKSDLYALGLVLFELFTGERAWPDMPPEAMVFQRQSSTPASPASRVGDLPESVERVIVRCLDPDPAKRPPSAQAVARALPGGDPLAEALAAGETPSPGLLAEAGHRDGLSRRAAGGLLAAVVVLLAAAFALQQRVDLTARVDLPRSPAVLQQRAHDIADAFGWSEPRSAKRSAWLFDQAAVQWLGRRDSLDKAWSVLDGPLGAYAFNFVHRESPASLRPWRAFFGQGAGATLDPPVTVQGEVLCTVNPVGHLRRFLAVPPAFDDSTTASAAAPWSAVFAAAGFDSVRFSEVPPYWSPERFGSERRAWEGVDTVAALPVRLEVAAHGGRIVSVRMLRPWMRPENQVATPEHPALRIFGIALIFVTFGLLGLLFWTARRNIALGHGDTRGAARLALFYTLMLLLTMALGSHYEVGPRLLDQFMVDFGSGLFLVTLLAAGYLALEPILRRSYPEMFVSWVRALDLRFSDPRVGRDLLVGVVAGVGLVAVRYGVQELEQWLPGRPATPAWPFETEMRLFQLADVTRGVTVLPGAVLRALIDTLQLLVLILLALRITRHPRAVMVLAWVLMLLFSGLDGTAGVWFMRLLGGGALLALAFRYGPLAVAASGFASALLGRLPGTVDPAHWAFGWVPFGAVCVLALAAAGAWAATRAPRDPDFGSGAVSRPAGARSLPRDRVDSQAMTTPGR
jgi:serine/threonine-protein kinase